MLPTSFDHHSFPIAKSPLPPAAKGDHAVTEKVRFFELLKPFIQLLMAIANAIFQPIKNIFKTELPAPSVVKPLPSPSVVAAPAQSAAKPVVSDKPASVVAPEPAKTDSAAGKPSGGESDTQLHQIENRFSKLEEKLKQGNFIVENMRELKLLDGEIEKALELLKTKKEENKDLIQKLTQVGGQLKQIGLQDGQALLNQFHHALEVLEKGSADLRSDVKAEMLETWEVLKSIVQPHMTDANPDFTSKASKKLAHMGKRMEALLVGGEHQNGPGLIEPLKLKNIGNSCHLDSVLQALACVDPICQDFYKTIPEDKKSILYQKKSAIQQEILQFLNNAQPIKGEELSTLGYVLSLFKSGPSLPNLREAIFSSGLKTEFNSDTVEKQHDAAEMMEFFLQHFVPSCRFFKQEFNSPSMHKKEAGLEPDFPGLLFPRKAEVFTKLVIPLRDEGDKCNQSLADLVKWVLYARWERDPEPTRIFDPKEGLIVDEVEGKKSQALEKKKVKDFVQWYHFATIPPVLVLQFQRSLFDATKISGEKKDERPVYLPSDGILDLTKYCGFPKDGPQEAKYKIKSVIEHHGDSVYEGHYVANVEIKGKYYHCDDMSAGPNHYKEIAEKEFYSQKKAYLVVLELIKSKEGV